MKKYYFILSIGILVLIVPTAIYLIILCPQLSERYNTLMASGGIIGAGGIAACAKIPESFKKLGIVKARRSIAYYPYGHDACFGVLVADIRIDNNYNSVVYSF